MKTINQVLPTANPEWKSDNRLLIRGRKKPYSSVCKFMGREYIMPEKLI